MTKKSPTVGEYRMSLLPKTTSQFGMARAAALKLTADGLDSTSSVQAYTRAINDLVDFLEAHEAPFIKATVNRYRTQMIEQEKGTSTINQRLSAIRKLSKEMAENGVLDHQIATGIAEIKNVKQRGKRLGNWLTKKQAQTLLGLPNDSIMGKRDKAVLALLVSTGLRRSECASLKIDQMQMINGRPALVDILGKGNRFRSIPTIQFAYDAVNRWLRDAEITEGYILRSFWKGRNRLRPGHISDQGIKNIVAQYGTLIGEPALRPHDLRRTFAQLSYHGGADLVQIQLSLGHESVKTTENYLGITQDFETAPADALGLEL
jgi:site-specific recombinase XerD